MKKPIHQLITENAVTILFSIGSLASIINGISNATRLITYKTGLVLLLGVFIVWYLLTYLVESGKIKWVTNTGYTVRLKKLGMKTELYFLGITLILAFHTVYDFGKGKSIIPEVQFQQPAFAANNQKLKILVLRWQKECSYQEKMYDIGLVLKLRFENMIENDSINLQVYYLPDSVNHQNFNKDSAYALMKYHHADLVLHGSYSLSECEGGTSDKICYMYQTDFKKLGLEATQDGNRYRMMDLHGLEDIREGAGQENIDFIIYWVAAMSEFKSKNFHKAVKMLMRIKDYQQKDNVLFQMSNCYFYMKDYNNAKISLEKVLAINPNHEEANIHLGMFLVQEGKGHLAKDRLEKVLVTNPGNLSVLRDLIVAYRSLKDTATSDLYLKKFLEVVPESDSTYKMLAAIYKDIGNFVKAKEYYEKAFKVCSRHADDWSVLGEMYMHLRDSLKARNYFRQALILGANSNMVFYNMGVLMQRDSNYEKAGEYLQKAMMDDSSDLSTLVALGINYSRLQKKESALECFKTVLSKNPNIVTALVNISVIYMEMGKHEQANRYLDRMVNYYPNDPKILNTIGYLCADKGNYSQAEIYYKRLLKLAPGNGAILYNLASMSGCQHKPVAALKYLSQALASIPALKKTAKIDKAFEEIRTEKRFIAITN